MSDGELLDLVCGPSGPLPETYQRYRLVAHLGSGGQAEVYRAVRLCGGVSSAPMTVKVFRVDPCRPLVDELRSWDKGDAVLMDLNNRGVSGICRRADGFYGPPPHRPGEPPAAGDAVPYQVYDYLHGINLRQYVTQHAGLLPGARRLNALAALRTLAGILRALHLPAESGATPVLHMDVKPANVMVLTGGDVRLIDFTGARYWKAAEITQIAYTPESGGPEVLEGTRAVGPAYDVHGFGAVAYFLVTAQYPRSDPHGPSPVSPDRAALRQHPLLERAPALRDHLHALLADRPADRPQTSELGDWVVRLGELVRRGGVADIGVDWAEPERAETARAETARVVGRAVLRPTVTGTETDAFQRIERLERELVELRAKVSRPETRFRSPAPGGGGSPACAETRVGAIIPVNRGGAPEPAGRGASPAPGTMRGRAAVPPPKPSPRSQALAGPGWSGDLDEVDGRRADAPRAGRPPQPAGRTLETLKRGWRLSAAGGVFAFVCWGVWALSAVGGGGSVAPLFTFSVVLAVAVGLFALSRLVGRLVIEYRLGRVRRSAKGSHAVAGLFLAATGVSYLKRTAIVVEAAAWFAHLMR